VADGAYGNLTPQGTWNGLPGEIVNGTADVIGSFFSVDEIRQSVVLYSTPYFSNGLVVVTLLEPVQPDAYYFIRPFKSRLWLSIFATAILAVALLYWVDRTSPFGNKRQFIDDKELSRLFNLPNAIHAILMPLIGQSAVRASAWSSRLLYIGFLLFCLITMSLFTANLTAFAVVRRYDGGAINSVWDIMANQASWCLAKDSEVDLWFSTNPDPRFVSMLQYATFTNSDESACISLLRSGQVQAVVTSLQIAQYQISLPPCQLQIVGTPFTQNYAAWAVSVNNATLQRALSRATAHYIQNGVVDQLFRSVISGPGSCNDADTNSGAINSSGMDVSNVSGIFYLTFFFFALGLLQLGLEIVLTRTVRGNTRFQRRLLRCCGWQRSLTGDNDDGGDGTAKSGINGGEEDDDDDSTDDGSDLKASASASARRFLLPSSRQASALDWTASTKGVVGAKSDPSRKRLLSEQIGGSVPVVTFAVAAAGGDGYVVPASAVDAAGGSSAAVGEALLLAVPPRKGSAPTWAGVSALARETSISQMLLPSVLLPHTTSSHHGVHRGSHSEGATSRAIATANPLATSGGASQSGATASVQLRTMGQPVVQPVGVGGSASSYFPPAPPA
jgi:Ligand-gated ion channel/Bacterial extracellular solute-binding proteins, family 3